jgi:alkylation response protein AidB-like acyl-CoA dehydrogenase
LQHTLADVSVALDGAQLLARKAAWAHDCGHDDAAELGAMAFLFAAEQAQRTSDRALHFHGGYGFMEEYDIQLFYRRAKGWANVLDEPAREYARVADLRYGPVAAAAS